MKLCYYKFGGPCRLEKFICESCCVLAFCTFNTVLLRIYNKSFIVSTKKVWNLSCRNHLNSIIFMEFKWFLQHAL